ARVSSAARSMWRATSCPMAAGPADESVVANTRIPVSDEGRDELILVFRPEHEAVAAHEREASAAVLLLDRLRDPGEHLLLGPPGPVAIADRSDVARLERIAGLGTALVGRQRQIFSACLVAREAGARPSFVLVVLLGVGQLRGAADFEKLFIRTGGHPLVDFAPR